MQLICHINDVAEGEARRFLIGSDNLILARTNGKLFAYRNECPHMNLPLANRSKAVINKEQNHLMCIQHAAEFSLENGLCVKGPCIGMKLEPVSIELTDDNVLLED